MGRVEMDTAPPTDTTDNVWKRIRIREKEIGDREKAEGVWMASQETANPYCEATLGYFMSRYRNQQKICRSCSLEKAE